MSGTCRLTVWACPPQSAPAGVGSAYCICPGSLCPRGHWAPNGQLSSLLSTVLDFVCDREKERLQTESRSSEDVLSAINMLNLDPSPSRVIGSMDVTALYPSLDAGEDSIVEGKLIGKICREDRRCCLDRSLQVIWPSPAPMKN